MTPKPLPTFTENSAKRISFILTTKNREKYIETALRRTKTYIKPNDELIIIDGGSVDQTINIINKYSDFVDVFISEKDHSVADACNKGILLARGKYIRHVTDDDELYPGDFDRAIQIMEQHPEIGLLVCGGTKQFGEKTHQTYLPPGINYGDAPEDVFKFGACGAGFIIRRSVLSVVGLMDSKNLAADFEFALRFIHYGVGVKFCRLNLFFHPILEHSYTTRFKREWKRSYLDSIRKYSRLNLYRLSSILRCYTLLVLIAKLHRISELVRLKGINWLFNEVFNRLKRGKTFDNTANEEKYIWDGGFS